MKLDPEREHIDFLSGFLMSSSQLNVSADWITILQSSGCKMKRKMSGDGWLLFEYLSNEPLLKDDASRTPPFIYRIVIRISGKKALFLSQSRRIVSHILYNAIDSSFRKQLSKVFIDTDAFVNHLTENQENYMLTLVHARVNEFGDQLSSMAFYGNDISNASMFRQHRNLLTVFTCGVREKKSTEELMVIGNNGFVSFNYLKSGNGAAIDNALGYINDNGFMRSPGDI